MSAMSRMCSFADGIVDRERSAGSNFWQTSARHLTGFGWRNAFRCASCATTRQPKSD
jgi:hypothetical protein